MAKGFAEKGWHFAQRQDQIGRPHGSNTPPGQSRRSYSTQAHGHRGDPSIALMTGDVDNYPSQLKDMRQQLFEFMEHEVYPIEGELGGHQNSPSRWTPHPLAEELKVV